MTTPTAQDVADFLGEGDDAAVVALAEKHLPFVAATVKGYTRGRGFSLAGEPDAEIALVITAAAARCVVNPAMHKAERIGDYSVTPGGYLGWTLPELAVLNRYRVRAR